jgi:REP element-mobilizing transposase RayT
MARKLRLEYAGAIYHVISRGNYRADVFGQDRTKAAFLGCLEEASLKAGWRVHAWCVMSNHYHVCLETPEPNLVAGMRWLQATFSLRFNRFRQEHGHVFQGRYKALPVEPQSAGAVCHYIHLNPVRAGIIKVEALPDWPWTSMSRLMSGRKAGSFTPVVALEHAGGLRDTPADRKRYLAYLAWLSDDDTEKKRLAFEQMSKDWAIGSREFKMDLIRDHKQLAEALHAQPEGERDIAREVWQERLSMYLAALKKSVPELRVSAKGAPWKVAVAAAMKTTTTASNPWLAEQLHMGSPFRLSRLVSACRADPQAFQPYVKAMTKCKV